MMLKHREDLLTGSSCTQDVSFRSTTTTTASTTPRSFDSKKHNKRKVNHENFLLNLNNNILSVQDAKEYLNKYPEAAAGYDFEEVSNSFRSINEKSVLGNPNKSLMLLLLERKIALNNFNETCKSYDLAIDLELIFPGLKHVSKFL